MKKVLAVVTFLAAACAFARAQQEPVPAEARKGYEALSPFNLRSYESVLTSDSLEGRKTAHPGQKRAAQYIASLFAKAGLTPLGTDGTYFQRFAVKVSRVDLSSTVTITFPQGKDELVWGQDYVSESLREMIVSGAVAFVGHTDCKVSDQDRAALADRIVFVLIGRRDFAGDTTQARFLRRLYSPRSEPSAAATVLVADDEGAASISRITQLLKDSRQVNGIIRLMSDDRPQGRSGLPFCVSAQAADRILRSAGRSLKEWRTLAHGADSIKPLLIDNVSVTLRSRIAVDTLSTENVVGLLEGSDPVLKSEVVAFTAHYDHMGKNSSGIIFRGADDDGSGTSAILDLAQAFSKNPVRPKRSLLFMTVVGEEEGLLGSAYYSTHPIIPLDRTIANLNIDMIGRVDEPHAVKGIERYVYVIGSDKISTELDSLLVLSNNETERLHLDYTFNDEKDPHQYYKRSDHYNFARFGVPVVFFFTGEHEDYHRPTDTADKLLYGRMTSIARLIYATGWKLANMPRMLRPFTTSPAVK